MRISECYTQIRDKRDSPIYEFSNKKFKYTVQFFTKDWTVTKRYFLKGDEISVDSIPNEVFSAMMQSDEWKLRREITSELPASNEPVES